MSSALQSTLPVIFDALSQCRVSFWVTFEKEQEQQIPSIAIFGKYCVELKKVE
jgi:hypothetical protein